jgi:hypothetical protein
MSGATIIFIYELGARSHLQTTHVVRRQFAVEGECNSSFLGVLILAGDGRGPMHTSQPRMGNVILAI